MTLPGDLEGARWIAGDVRGGRRSMAPAPYLRRSFRVDRPLRSARLSITALGLYEAEINGQRVGDDVLSPGWTDYRVRCHYQIHDVTALLADGENVLGAILGDGWYCGHIAWVDRQAYGEKPALLACLRLEYADGSTESIVTDCDWHASTGPILENDLLMGETYDARYEMPGWSSPGFAADGWRSVQVLPPVAIELCVSPGPPIRRMEELAVHCVRDVTELALPIRVFDLGQNFSGRLRITIEAPHGATLMFRFGEALNPDGSVYRENLRGARATDIYTCRGGGPEVWEPRFTFHGFRYVEVGGFKSNYRLDLTGIALYSDMPATGTFACSNALLNQLQSNIQWSLKGNFLDVPTDCPQRDERLGWTGDAQVFIRTACFNRDVRAFFHKWTRDLRDAQGPEGGVPCIAPKVPALEHNIPHQDGGPAWSDALIICPWTIYLCYGDCSILAENYDAMERFMAFLAERRCSGGIRSHPDVDPWGGYGDWLALDGSGANDEGTPRDLIGTAYYAYVAGIMSRIAGILGHAESAAKYRDLKNRVAAAFRERFVTPAGYLASGRQTAYVLALHFGLLDEEIRPFAARELVRDIQSRRYHLSTGFVGTPHLLSVLEENGHLDVAYKLLEQETFPSWLFPVVNGATTIWERWNGWTIDDGMHKDKGMNSFNHYAYGAVGAWLYRSVAGLDLDETEPGYKKLIFRPRPGGTLTWAEATLETIHGQARIRWEKQPGTLTLDLTVPPGTTATLDLLNEWHVSPESNILAPGTHRLVAECDSGS